MKIKGVYLIFSTINDKCYVGSSLNIKNRLSKHFRDLANNKHYNKKLQNHVNKYGLDSISSCILFSDADIDQTKLRQIEEQHITLYDSTNTGFNILAKTSDIVLTDSARKIISEKSKVRQSNLDYKKNLSEKYSGSKSVTAKLSTKDISYIKSNAVKDDKRYKNISELAKKFKVNKKTIYRVLHNITYKNE